MKILVSLIALTLSTAVTHAAVLPIDPNGDGQSNAFLDVVNGLVWTNANASDPLTLNAAKTAITDFSIEGITTWRMPTVSEYRSLFQTQGGDGSGIVEFPFTVPFNNYWSSDVNQDNLNQDMTFAVHAVGAFTTAPFSLNVPVGVWAVSSVPETPSVALLFTGLLAVLGSLRKRSRGDA